MRILFIIALMCASTVTLKAQKKLITKTGYTSFFSSAPLEDITAVNKQVVAVLDTKTGNIQVKMLMKSFHFEKALMQEHFNENYIESDKFPKATFDGFIVDFLEIPEGKSEHKVKGVLNIHGKNKNIEALARFQKLDKNITISGEFNVNVRDFDIDIPEVVINNISQTIQVSVYLSLNPY